jgi:hypothetical protein
MVNPPSDYIPVEKMEYNKLYADRNNNYTTMLVRGNIDTKFVKFESDPNGKSAKEAGSKLDAGKSPVFQGLLDYFPRACLAIAEVSAAGAAKYSWKGFAEVPDGVNRYANAGARHILYEAIEGPYDNTMIPPQLHKAQKAWNSLAELELYLRDVKVQDSGHSSDVQQKHEVGKG